ncbi:hypothetical protein ACIQPR_03990 [Streptomyces sp. NPDC091280]|uniref:hypothetical protein n=1 Tax=Streptomyces sp. NPDC091280 TaxID=3365984 RepID=UPI0038132464
MIVTHADHDFVDLTIRATAESAAKQGAKDGAKSLAKKVARKAAFGLAASAAVLGALGASHDHGADQVSAAETVAAASSVTPGHSGKVGGEAPVAQGAHLTTTFHHPFYDETQSAFVEGKEPRECLGGTALRSLTPVDLAAIESEGFLHTGPILYPFSDAVDLHARVVRAADHYAE